MKIENSSKRLILVLGPTAVGKTDKAIELALNYHCPVLSCDSRQLYKELNIGVAKPSREQLKAVKHHFIDHVSIHQEYDAGKFAVEARELINILFDQFDDLVICGGTGLYVRSLIKGLDALPGKNELLRNELEENFKIRGIGYLQNELKTLDPNRYEQTDVLNPQRLIRAIEITRGEVIDKINLPEFKYEFELETVMMEMDRKLLYERINNRVDQMIELGLEDEARQLYEYRALNALQTVGYKEWWPYFEGECSKETVIEKIKQHTRNYAKRQITWFRHQLL